MLQFWSDGSRAAPAGLDDLPLALQEVVAAGRTWSVLAVRDQQALLDAADRFQHVPYGLLLWESAVALAHHIAAQAGGVAGRDVLELGAGVGFSGMVAASLGARVVQSDHEPAALELCRRNAVSNRVPVPEVFLADWRRWEHAARYDVVIGADIVYERDMHSVLAQVLRRCTAPSGRLILADPGRPHTLDFLAALEDDGWRGRITTLAVRTLHPLASGASSVDVTIAELSPPF